MSKEQGIQEGLAVQILDLHLTILTELLQGFSFEKIRQRYIDEIEMTKYLDVVSHELLSFDDNHQLIGSYPISPHPTPYKIRVRGIGAGYSMCAVDALGVAYTFGRVTEIETIDHSTQEHITLHIDPANPQKDIPLYVSYSSPDVDNPALQQCPTIHFYSSKQDIPKTLTVKTFEEALDRAIQQFSPQGFQERIQKLLEKSAD